MKKRMSTMTEHEFVQAVSRLHANYKGMAKLIGKDPSTVSAYVTGRRGIPLEVTEKIDRLLSEEAKKVEELRLSLHLDNMTNQILGPVSPPAYRGGTEGRFLNRLSNKLNLAQLPTFNMRKRQWITATCALKEWSAEVHKRRRETGVDWQLEQYSREIVDLRCIVGSWPRKPPYRVVLAKVEWQVLSRALRHSGETLSAPRSLYQTMRKFYLRDGMDGRKFNKAKRGEDNA